MSLGSVTYSHREYITSLSRIPDCIQIDGGVLCLVEYGIPPSRALESLFCFSRYRDIPRVSDNPGRIPDASI